jgi:hypothetical protein
LRIELEWGNIQLEEMLIKATQTIRQALEEDEIHVIRKELKRLQVENETLKAIQ